jgi:predicted O-methyltransferase YrrM
MQIDLMQNFDYGQELLEFPMNKISSDKNEFYYNNGSFESGDAEYYYSMLRYFKPKKIIEIGSGFSTLLATSALKKNLLENNLKGEILCIDPYRKKSFDVNFVKVIDKKVEELDLHFFKEIGENDFLFIDSSHIIRPQGDVLFEYLEILPTLNSGVIIHIHDIFTPKDYLDSWIIKEHILWNEQYLLEAFLTNNNQFQIIGALNFLAHNFREKLNSCCPVFSKQPGREPGSFWIKKL